MKDNHKTALFYHLPAMLYAALIIILSSMPNLQPPDFGVLTYDKLLHFVEYAVFAFLFYRSFSQLKRLNTKSIAALITFALLLVFSVGDEFHQKFVPGRTSDIFDVLADVLGGALVILVLHRWNKSRSGER